MQKYIIKQFEVVENGRTNIYAKDERSGNYAVGTSIKGLMDFMCLSNSRIWSIERQPFNDDVTRETFTVGDRIVTNNGTHIQSIKIVLGEVIFTLNGGTTSNPTIKLKNAVKYVPPTAVVEEPVRAKRKYTRKVANNEVFNPIQSRIEDSFQSTGPIRLSGTLKKTATKLGAEEFLYRFFTNWNLTNGDLPKTTVYVNTGEIQCITGKRRSLGDIFMILKYYFPEITLKEVLTLLYTTLPERITTGFRTSKCSEIHKRVWYYSPNSSNTIASTTENDEYGYLYQWYQENLNS